MQNGNKTIPHFTMQKQIGLEAIDNEHKLNSNVSHMKQLPKTLK